MKNLENGCVLFSALASNFRCSFFRKEKPDLQFRKLPCSRSCADVEPTSRPLYRAGRYSPEPKRLTCSAPLCLMRPSLFSRRLAAQSSPLGSHEPFADAVCRPCPRQSNPKRGERMAYEVKFEDRAAGLSASGRSATDVWQRFDHVAAKAGSERLPQAGKVWL